MSKYKEPKQQQPRSMCFNFNLDCSKELPCCSKCKQIPCLYNTETSQVCTKIIKKIAVSLTFLIWLYLSFLGSRCECTYNRVR